MEQEYVPERRVTRSNVHTEYNRLLDVYDNLNRRLLELTEYEDQNKRLVEQLEQQSANTQQARANQEALEGELLAMQGNIESVRAELIAKQNECVTVGDQIVALTRTNINRTEREREGADKSRADLEQMTANANMEQQKKQECRNQLNQANNEIRALQMRLRALGDAA